MGLDLEKELDVELARPDGSIDGVANEGRKGFRITVPPPPPVKESSASPRKPTPWKLQLSRPGSASPSGPPTRPLPAKPMSSRQTPSPSGLPGKPAPTRPPPLRPQAPLAMNPPTRPGTAASGATSQASDWKAPPRIIGSTKRLSYGSISLSRRPIKYGQGKFKNIELVPQPSDDPDDPLVSLALLFLRDCVFIG